MLRVSVVIPTHNHARFLGEAIKSALGQTHPPAEVIVIDDGSTDNTAEVLSGFGDRIQVVHQRNSGVPAARNAGAVLASCDLLAFLDADDAWLPKKLERQVARFLAEPDLGLVHCGVEEIDAAGVCITRKIDGLEGWVADELLLFRRPVILGGGSGTIVTREAFCGVGGFDSKMSTSADWDFYYRVARRHKIGFVPEVLLRYRVHGSNMHRNIRVMERDMLHAYAKAFAEVRSRRIGLRRRAYGNLHSVLAGSFFSVGQYSSFCSHAAKSIVLTPENIPHFLLFPLRRWRRRGARSGPAVSQEPESVVLGGQLGSE